MSSQNFSIPSGPTSRHTTQHSHAVLHLLWKKGHILIHLRDPDRYVITRKLVGSVSSMLLVSICQYLHRTFQVSTQVMVYLGSYSRSG
jgi:hypothetical protein